MIAPSTPVIASESLTHERIQELVTEAVRDDPRVLAVDLFGSRTKVEGQPVAEYAAIPTLLGKQMSSKASRPQF